MHVPTQILREPFTYIASVPGKEVRSALMEAFNVWMKVDKADLTVVKEVVGMLHNASLLSVELVDVRATPRASARADGPGLSRDQDGRRRGQLASSQGAPGCATGYHPCQREGRSSELT